MTAMGVKRVFVAVLLYSAQYPAYGQTTATIRVWGIGGKSCAYWVSNPMLEQQGEVWLFGFFTAANWDSSTSRQVGSNTDVFGVLAEVKKACAEIPSQTLSKAAMIAYNRMLAVER